MPRTSIPPRGGARLQWSEPAAPKEDVDIKKLYYEIDRLKEENRRLKSEKPISSSFTLWGVIALCAGALLFAIMAVRSR